MLNFEDNDFTHFSEDRGKVKRASEIESPRFK